MAERKVLNKYYPPDYDPSIIPRGKGGKFRQFCIRTMAPFNMRCNTCGEFIYKGKKFNSRKENVKGEFYLGLDIFRFYIRCTRCLAEITYKTDPENTDYKIEHGATRNFEAETVLKKLEDEKIKKLEEELIQNPMKILENRTKESQREMEILENLEELKEMQARNYQIDHDALLQKHTSKHEKSDQSFFTDFENDETLLKQILAEQKQQQTKRIFDEFEDEEEIISNKKIISEITSTHTTEASQLNNITNASINQVSSTTIPQNSGKRPIKGGMLAQFVVKKPKLLPQMNKNNFDIMPTNAIGLNLLTSYSSDDSN